MLGEFNNNIIEANFPLTEDNRVHHVGVKEGEVSNLIITVGDISRAWRIAELLDEDLKTLKSISSTRGFLTITGHYKNKIVSIISIGMGLSMMDFFVREISSIVKGTIYIVRIGSCGTIDNSLSIGSLILVESSALITRNYDNFLNNSSNLNSYIFSKPVKGDIKLEDKIIHNLKDNKYKKGLNITTDSFYSSQFRTSNQFEDKNDKLYDEILSKYPNTISLEMETFMLYHLAKCSFNNRIKAYAVQIVFADRVNNVFINSEDAVPIVYETGKLVLDALLSID